MNEPGRLSGYLVEKRAAMEEALRARPLPDQWHTQLRATCVSDDATGVRKLRIRQFEFVGDSDASFGGTNQGPTSPELLCGVLGTCLVHTHQIGASWLRVPLERIAIDVVAENNDARFVGLTTTEPPMPFDFVVNVALDAPAADLDELSRLRAYVEDTCPMVQLIRAEVSLIIRHEISMANGVRHVLA